MELATITITLTSQGTIGLASTINFKKKFPDGEIFNLPLFVVASKWKQIGENVKVGLRLLNPTWRMILTLDLNEKTSFRLSGLGRALSCPWNLGSHPSQEKIYGIVDHCLIHPINGSGDWTEAGKPQGPWWKLRRWHWTNRVWTSALLLSSFTWTLETSVWHPNLKFWTWLKDRKTIISP